LKVTATAAVEIEAWPEAIADSLSLVEIFATDVEEDRFVG
jgi:hypothetical protein